MKRFFRWLIVSILALWKGLSQKELGPRAGMAAKQISYYFRTKGREIDDEPYGRLLAGLGARPAEVAIVTGAVEDLNSLEMETSSLTPAERDWVETTKLEISRRARKALEQAVLRSRQLPPLDEYPQPDSLEAARWHAGEWFSLLQDLPEDQQLAVVRLGRQLKSWALMERYCEESVVQASRDLERAAFLARVAQVIAARFHEPEGWGNRIRGYALGHGANLLKVKGELEAAWVALEEAKRLWHLGSDPDGVLDPGRLLDLEASLCRDQRRFEEALSLLDQARAVSRYPARALIMKGFTLEVMGEHERAIGVLLEAETLPDLQADPRLRTIRDCNLGLCLVHVGRFAEAAGLAQQVREVAIEMGDEIWVLRALWLEGRIAAGLGRREEALRLLGQARREFARRDMSYDVALALLEEAVLLLEQGQSAAVKALAGELTQAFKSKGVHREALAALELFRLAAEREEATAELARHLLAYLFRARYDQGLRFSEASLLTPVGVPPAAGFGLGWEDLPAVGVNPGARLATAVGVHPAAFLGGSCSGALATAAGVHSAAFLGERFAPEGGEEGPERIEQAGRGQQGQDEGEGEKVPSHRRFSRAAPAAGLRGPRGPRLFPHGAEKSQSALAGARTGRKNLIVRLFRAVSGLTQRAFAWRARIHYTTLNLYESGLNDPTPHMDQVAEAADLTVADGELILQCAEALREIRRRAGRGGFKGLLQDLGIVVSGPYVRLLRLPLPESRPEDRQLAVELWQDLEDLPEDQQVAVVRRCEEYQSWALVEICCEESIIQASRDLDRAASLARLAQETAEHVRGTGRLAPEGPGLRGGPWSQHPEGYRRVEGGGSGTR